MNTSWSIHFWFSLPDYREDTDRVGVISSYEGVSVFLTTKHQTIGIYDGHARFNGPRLFGSVVGLTNSSGALVNTYQYDPFGNILQSETVVQPYKFAGVYYDGEYGLYKMSARYYDQTVGRWGFSQISIPCIDFRSGRQSHDGTKGWGGGRRDFMHQEARQPAMLPATIREAHRQPHP